MDPVSPDRDVIERAAARLREGGLVAFPTETVYGLGADATNPRAIAAIFEAKGRPSYNPLIVHVATVDAARALAAAWPDAATALSRRFWPGPLTLVLESAGRVAPAVTAGLRTIAVRIPSHPVARALLRAADIPVAAPSANVSTALSPTTAEHVALGLADRVGLILDAGPAPVGIESTVVSLADRPTLLRAGIIPAPEIEQVTGRLARPTTAETRDEARPSPGMLDRHYAPRATLRLYASHDRDSAVAAARGAATAGQTVGALLLRPLDAPLDHARAMPDDPAAYARLLYATLHALDAAGCDLILVEAVPDTPSWEGVRDRLQRAASGSP